MKSLIFLATIVAASAFVRTRTVSPKADAAFSYHLQGTKVSGGVVDEILMNNTGIVTQTEKGKKLQFFLNDAYDEKADAFSHSLRFAIPGKTGSVSLKTDDDDGNVQLFIAAGADGKYNLYGNEAFTVTISSINATRVSGTFSGKMKGVMGKTDEETITDGKFDIPVRAGK